MGINTQCNVAVLNKTAQISDGRAEHGTAQDKSEHRLPATRKVAYGFGHVFTDLCGNMWFSYLVLFLHAVVRVDNTHAGVILLIGQVFDAISTPIFGLLSDKTKSRYGKRKTWHLIGTVLLAISWFFLWHECLFCGSVSEISNVTNTTYNCSANRMESEDFSYQTQEEELYNGGDYDYIPGNTGTITQGPPFNWRIVYFAVPAIIFALGFASTQVSHLSLIPELTKDEGERVGLNAIRNGARIIASVSVFVVMFALLETLGRSTGDNLVPEDLWIFSGSALGIIAVGILCSLIFHIGTRESDTCTEENKTTNKKAKKLHSVFKWFIKPHFYMVALIYMCTRLVINISQVYLPLFLVDSLQLNKYSVAIGPLVVYVSGFAVTLGIKFFNKLFGRYLVYLTGLVLIWGGLLWFWLQATPSSVVEEVFLYGATVLIGAGGAILLVTSLSMVADLIGEDTGSSGFVYGLMSCIDKVSSGVTVVVIQAMHPCQCAAQVCCSGCEVFYRKALVLVPGSASLLGCVAVLLLIAIIYRKSKTWKAIFPLCSKKVAASGDTIVSKAFSKDTSTKQGDVSPVQATV